MLKDLVKNANYHQLLIVVSQNKKLNYETFIKGKILTHYVTYSVKVEHA